MKVKNIFLLGLIIISPVTAKASGEEIKEIRGNKNYFQDLMLDNSNMYIDINDFKKYGLDPKEVGLDLNLDDNIDIDIDANKDYENPNNKDDKKENNDEKSSIIKELSGRNFTFKSGTGEWDTKLKFVDDKGSFEVEYVDVDPDLTYVSKAKGKFSIDEKVNNTAYILKLDEFEITSPTGKSDKKDGKVIKYHEIPHGMEGKDKNTDKFTLYLPGRERSDMSKDVNDWIEKRETKGIDKVKSNAYILVNNDEIYTFIED